MLFIAVEIKTGPSCATESHSATASHCNGTERGSGHRMHQLMHQFDASFSESDASFSESDASN
jgi:hypothetical protein